MELRAGDLPMSEPDCMPTISGSGIGARIANLEEALSARRNPTEFGV